MDDHDGTCREARTISYEQIVEDVKAILEPLLQAGDGAALGPAMAEAEASAKRVGRNVSTLAYMYFGRHGGRGLAGKSVCVLCGAFRDRIDKHVEKAHAGLSSDDQALVVRASGGAVSPRLREEIGARTHIRRSAEALGTIMARKAVGCMVCLDEGRPWRGKELTWKHLAKFHPSITLAEYKARWPELWRTAASARRASQSHRAAYAVSPRARAALESGRVDWNSRRAQRRRPNDTGTPTRSSARLDRTGSRYDTRIDSAGRKGSTEPTEHSERKEYGAGEMALAGSARRGDSDIRAAGDAALGRDVGQV